MGRASDPRSRPWTAVFEWLDARLYLTAQPVVDFQVDFADISQSVERPEDFPRMLVDAQEASGGNYAREKYGFAGSGQTVAVIDSGIAYDHFALGGGFGEGYRVVGGWDFTEENDGDPYDDAPAGYHGTHVAGIIGSNDDTFTGVAPAVDMVALRVFNDQGEGSFAWVEDALQWVHEHRHAFASPITTVNLSLGMDWNSNAVPTWTTLEDEFSQLADDGIFIAVAAGNAFAEHQAVGLSYPASSQHVVPVASHNQDGLLSEFSQRNHRVLAAPGQSIASTAPDYLYSFGRRHR